mmetsp:Transcript_34736/g.59545  ORF Transcript_34736/g.59545 Transcript_34736/m.59545 type:complete len:110 (+) Transcript_34736:24-353(+)
MAVLTGSPPKPVIHGNPPPGLIIRNFHAGDYAVMGFMGAVMYYVGKFHRQPRKLMKYNAAVFGITGLTGGFFYAFQLSSQRLMGWRDNDKEVSKYPFRLDTLIDKIPTN